MKREDFERLKEKEKAHLREIQKLKQRLREAERARSIGKALGDVQSAGSTDSFDEALEKVQLEVAEGQAKLELAVDSTGGPDADLGNAKMPDPNEMEGELTKARAAELVRHMKLSMGMQEGDEAEEAAGAGDAERKKTVGKATGDEQQGAESNSGKKPESTGSDVSKTIGRMKSADD